jgi:hypothetical protein
MNPHRNLMLAAAMTAAAGFTALPAQAQDIKASEGYETSVMRSDTWKPGYTKTEDGHYEMIVPETQEEAEGYPMQVVRSDTWKPGYVKSSDGDYVLLAPAAEPTDDSVEIIRSDTWKPGFMKSSDGDYIKMVPMD